MGVLEKISAFLFPLAMGALAIGFAWQCLTWLATRSHPDYSVFPPGATVAASILTLVLGAWLMERFLPLRALTAERWIYRDRPRQRLRSLDVDTVLQLLGFMGAGLLLG